MADAPFVAYIFIMKNNNFTQNQNQKSAGLSKPAPEMQSPTMFAPSADEVARRAYFCYVNQGSPQGRDVQHWLEAEAELIVERNRTRTHGFHNHN
jgi:Protein of unknown function (DUF2934)